MTEDHFSPPAADIEQNTTVVYAGFWRRIGAALIDTVLALLIMLPLLFVFFGTSYFDDDQYGLSGPIDIFINYVLPITLTVFFWMVFKATPGKMVMGCEVINAKTGEKLGLGRSIVRYFGYMVSTIPLCLGLFWVGIDKRKQGWHDKIAGTLVVRKGSAASVKNSNVQ